METDLDLWSEFWIYVVRVLTIGSSKTREETDEFLRGLGYWDVDNKDHFPDTLREIAKFLETG